MILEAITLGVIGVTYVTGDAHRKQKMRKVGSDIVEITKAATRDAVAFTKDTIEEVKAKRAAKKNNS